MTAPVDYDALAATYNRRFEGQVERPPTLRALETLARNLDARHILEVGCGTAHWLAKLGDVAPGLYGLDPSAGMLAQARQRPAALRLIRGRGETLPLAAHSLDLVYCVNAIHHITGQRAFIEAAYRVLRPGGALAVLGMSPHGRRDSWYVYRYFEGTYEADLARFPPWETVIDWMVDAGLTAIERQPVRRFINTWTGEAVLDDPFLQKHAASQLALLSDEAYEAGLRRIRSAIAEAQARGEPQTFRSEILIEMFVGHKPPYKPTVKNAT